MANRPWISMRRERIRTRRPLLRWSEAHRSHSSPVGSRIPSLSHCTRQRQRNLCITTLTPHTHSMIPIISAPSSREGIDCYASAPRHASFPACPATCPRLAAPSAPWPAQADSAASVTGPVSAAVVSAPDLAPVPEEAQLALAEQYEAAEAARAPAQRCAACSGRC
jgi:hypothetical protein